MRRLLFASIALTACLVALPASAQARNFDTLTAFKRVLPAVQDTTGVPIRIPRRVKLVGDLHQPLYVTGRATTSRYSLEVDFAKDCGGATACFGALFSGQRGSHLAGGRRVGLAKGLKGRFFPTSCGASCAKPQIQWFQNGVTYTIQLAVREPERDSLVKLANAAIRAPRL
jgi:hypothetical protein